MSRFVFSVARRERIRIADPLRAFRPRRTRQFLEVFFSFRLSSFLSFARSFTLASFRLLAPLRKTTGIQFHVGKLFRGSEVEGRDIKQTLAGNYISDIFFRVDLLVLDIALGRIRKSSAHVRRAAAAAATKRREETQV